MIPGDFMVMKELPGFAFRVKVIPVISIKKIDCFYIFLKMKVVPGNFMNTYCDQEIARKCFHIW